MIIDTSAIIAILRNEQEAISCVQAIAISGVVTLAPRQSRPPSWPRPPRWAHFGLFVGRSASSILWKVLFCNAQFPAIREFSREFSTLTLLSGRAATRPSKVLALIQNRYCHGI
jgi:hypothetical protein